jgi:branched-chain amino acid transport system permease protein
MNAFAQALVSGLMSGAVYALLATGMVLAYNTTRVVNLAHGETYAVAGLTAAGISGAELPMYVALPAGILAAILFSLIVERVFLRPRRHWPVGSLILVTLAIAFLTRGALQTVMGVDALSFPRLAVGPPLHVLGGVMPRQGLVLVVVGFAAASGVTLFLLRTATGRRLRAAAENADVAELVGIDVDGARRLAFGIAGALGGLGAILLVPMISVDFQTGLGMTLRGFIAAALAGMSPSLAVVAGLALGLGEAMVTTYVGALAQDPIVFLALILVALWQSRKILFGGTNRA